MPVKKKEQALRNTFRVRNLMVTLLPGLAHDCDVQTLKGTNEHCAPRNTTCPDFNTCVYGTCKGKSATVAIRDRRELASRNQMLELRSILEHVITRLDRSLTTEKLKPKTELDKERLRGYISDAMEEIGVGKKKPAKKRGK